MVIFFRYSGLRLNFVLDFLARFRAGDRQQGLDLSRLLPDLLSKLRGHDQLLFLLDGLLLYFDRLAFVHEHVLRDGLLGQQSLDAGLLRNRGARPLALHRGHVGVQRGLDAGHFLLMIPLGGFLRRYGLDTAWLFLGVLRAYYVLLLLNDFHRLRGRVSVQRLLDSVLRGVRRLHGVRDLLRDAFQVPLLQCLALGLLHSHSHHHLLLRLRVRHLGTLIVRYSCNSGDLLVHVRHALAPLHMLTRVPLLFTSDLLLRLRGLLQQLLLQLRRGRRLHVDLLLGLRDYLRLFTRGQQVRILLQLSDV